MYCLYASPVMMLLLAVVDCSANRENFEHEPSLANKVCPIERRVFEKKTVSRVACMAVASLEPDCEAVGYNKEHNMCYGCDTTTGEFQALEGTMFYSRPKAYPDGFEDISGYILMIVPDHSWTYDQAHDACAAHSASLVRIDSPEKQTAIKNHLDTLSGTSVYYWIQCRKDTSDGVWKFDDETPVPMTNDYWYGSYPVNYEGWNCGYTTYSASRYWTNDLCDSSRGYICEIK